MNDYKKGYKEIMADHFPEDMKIIFGEQTLEYKKKSWNIKGEKKGLRYGENPGQEAAVYELVNGNLILGECEFIGPGNGLISALSDDDLVQAGKHPGKTNLTDVDSALNILKFFPEKPAVVIVKHNNPSGVAVRDTLIEAYKEANFCDRLAAFGGAAVFNRTIDKETAEEISKYYLEVVCAPGFDDNALEILKQKKNLRIMRIKNIEKLQNYQSKRFVEFKSLIDGGVIVQQSPMNTMWKKEDFQKAECDYKGKKYIIQREPTEKEYEDMLFGWKVELGVTSNSVLYVKNQATVGIGTGEQDRVGVAEIAAFKAYKKYADRLCFEKHGIAYWELELKVKNGEMDKAAKEEIDKKTEKEKGGIKGSIMISDAFFPFRDGVDAGIIHGVTGIVHPGGSIRDFDSIEACNEANVTMVLTGQRAFKH
ncbi:MAG: IMP cyclohydrolase [bacterium]|nr:IMP cyclohydrolase [bacterium]